MWASRLTAPMSNGGDAVSRGRRAAPDCLVPSSPFPAKLLLAPRLVTGTTRAAAHLANIQLARAVVTSPREGTAELWNLASSPCSVPNGSCAHAE
ncbi:hypothetical protein HPB50_018928 [Hyalomma asiaticum]|uniref:Uncharacterized protein n=1 Tax=Hyalomma asiaticum TaxID=266040 RepID=A0ACB7SRX8_HYAAI|nr:hypothetical protein HPB50_018928 [Hyalomma asiaticum]